ncbi:BamA/TamA family outer membrane protein [Rapidithrix thailandica]|uniref:BamA/TamA family outer membrane protein n=1 Tax=Rapidithrix thailandica TaxID=413964 RepID=A0AAW9S8X2_9BACT
MKTTTIHSRILYITLWLGCFTIQQAVAQRTLFYNPSAKGWQEQQPSPDDRLYHTIFLIGDAGDAQQNPLEPNLVNLGQQLEATGNKSSLVFLGDNLYPKGLPLSHEKDREAMEQRLLTQLELAQKSKGRVVFVPGNHDWAQGRSYGLERILEQEKFVKNYLQDSLSYLPGGGCPGPVEIPVGDDLVLVVIDTQWWLHPHKKPGEGPDENSDELSDCEYQTDEEFLIALDDIIKQNEHKKIVVLAHHPLASVGTHGGHAPAIQHVFPLTDAKKNLWVPLPGLGSVYVFYRTVMGNIQDTPHPRYKLLRKALQKIFATHPNIIYASGHDHSLQYLQLENVHQVISGAGGKTDYVAKNKKAMFGALEKGFARLDFYQSGDVWLSFYIARGEGGTLAYQKKLFTQKVDLTQLEQKRESIDYTGQTTSAQATEGLASNAFKRFWLGDNYRKEWRQEIRDVPVFDLGKEKGGLEILKKGGGMQTRSLRLRANDGKEYVLRSVEKFPEKAVPVELRGTIAAKVVEEQISGAHPYAALVVPPLAKAAGVYHTNPELVYLPDDPRLGKYRADFGGALYLFEERPDEDWREAAFFGNSKDIKSTAKVLEKTGEDNDDLVDQKLVLRSRIFDMWIGDWDRHEDQWRWAEQKHPKKGYKYYEPIPRDRDQVFFNAEGLLMDVGTRKWGIRKFQGFKKEIRDPAGLFFNSRYFDRSFLTEPDLEDWLEETERLQSLMTDSLIEGAIRQFPKEVYPYHGPQIVEKLKSRRDHLKGYSEILYKALAKNVDITGSDKHELFKVERLNDRETRVRVWKIKKEDAEKKHKMYDRIFKTGETKEIRLYGLGGHDRFVLSGNTKKGLKVRIIAGEGPDSIVDSSSVAGLRKKTIVYDTPSTSELVKSKETKDLRSTDPNVNEYNRKAFKFDYLGPTAFFGYNPDDGLFVGGGVLLKTHGFRKAPYKQKHELKGNIAPKTSSFSFVYQGEFIEVIKKWDFLLKAEVMYPSFVDYFYGLGNETLNERDMKGKRYYTVRYNQIQLFPRLRKRMLNDQFEWILGGYYRSIELRDEQTEFPNRYIYNEHRVQIGEGAIERILGDEKHYMGFYTQLLFDNRNSEFMPTRGVTASFLAGRVLETNGSSEMKDVKYNYFTGSFSLYLSLGDRFKTTLASRVGGGINEGNYQQLYQGNRLGGSSTLRGYRRMRFAGDKSFYWNNELRFKIFNLRSLLLNAEVGLNGIYDQGRVWVENDPSTPDGKSDKWHRGYGGGVWMAPFNAAVIAVDFTHSEEEDLIANLRLGFMF